MARALPLERMPDSRTRFAVSFQSAAGSCLQRKTDDWQANLTWHWNSGGESITRGVHSAQVGTQESLERGEEEGDE
ncbi:hypothetical protein MMYC01_203900 [Madurella mycetomatis]|uniref:Uncharacterized protein n=1 Tax=Madurella mycetomatis TaxID=100816 RepID=A0A175WDH4_9PEZI|nr:hypothetical protein MMYC01_203900 [Madurella mycetomatis]